MSDVMESMSLEKARSLLCEKHNMAVDDRDPILLLVTLHQGFIADYERMLKRHHLALTTMIGEAVGGLTEEALSQNLQAQVHLADRIGKEFKAQYKRAKLLNWISTIAACVCLPVLIYLIVK